MNNWIKNTLFCFFVLVCVYFQNNTFANNDNAKLLELEVEYFRQTDYAEFGLSACGPTSTAMILNYHYPSAHVTPGQVYHSGSQIYTYDGPVQYYRNVGFQLKWKNANEISDTYFKNVPNGKKYYNQKYRSDGHRGNLKNYIELYWDGKFEKLKNYSIASLKSALDESGPLLANVNVCGGSGGHFITIVGIDENTNEIIVNDPYPCSSYKEGHGKKQKIKHNRFVSHWIKSGIYSVSFDYTNSNLFVNDNKHQVSKLDNIILVDSAHLLHDGYFSRNPIYGPKEQNSSVYKYTIYDYEKFDDKLSAEKTRQEKMYNFMLIENENFNDIRYYYLNGKDGVYLDKNSKDKVINKINWLPSIKKEGFYKISFITYDNGAKATLNFNAYDSNGKNLREESTFQYTNSRLVRKEVLWDKIFLRKGSYVSTKNIPADVNVDAIQFKFLSHGIESIELEREKIVISGSFEHELPFKKISININGLSEDITNLLTHSSPNEIQLSLRNYNGDLTKKAFEIKINNLEPASYPYIDVPSSLYFAERLAIFSWYKIASGYKTKHKVFRPDNNITRAEFIKLMTEAMALDIPEKCELSSTYKDIESTDWYCTRIQLAYDLGWIEEADKFNPNNPIQRDEAVKLLVISLGMENQLYPQIYGYNDNISHNVFFFDDVKDINTWNYKYIYIAKQNDIINGYPVKSNVSTTDKPNQCQSDEGTDRVYTTDYFCPSDKLTRGQAIKVIYEAYD